MDEIKFETLKPEHGDIIICRYRMYALTRDNLWHIFKSMRDTFPNNKVLLIPDEASITKVNNGQLKKMLEQIEKLIESNQGGGDEHDCD